MKKLIQATLLAALVSTPAWSAPIEAQPYPKGDWRIATSTSYQNMAPKLGTVDAVFIGDSITHGWHMPWVKDSGTNVWKEELKPLYKYNMGISGDKIENVLWRLTEGKQLEKYRAKVFVLMIGANNLKENSDQEIAEGIKKLITVIKEKQPHSKILLLGLLPVAWHEGRNASVNKIIAEYADGMTVYYLDLSKEFLTEDNKIKNMRDGIHPNEAGYRAIAKQLLPEIQKLIK